MKIYRCNFCKYNIPIPSNRKQVIDAKHKMGKHYDTKHRLLLPEGMNGYRYFYYLLTGKDKGSCIECHNETDFNEKTMKYSRFCNNPMCKQKYKEERDKRMIDKYGKVYLLDDPEMQKKMLANRKISGEYIWSDNKSKFTYSSSYELDFLKYLDYKLYWPSSDLFSPSPHTYIYHYKGDIHFYIPDFYIPSLGLEVEIKDDGSALNINQESREKDKLKEEMMQSLTRFVKFIKIVNKNYTKFEELLKEEEP